MELLAPVLGVLLVGAVGVDVLRTVLVPSSSGPVNLLVARALWRTARAVPGRLHAPALRAAGPSALVVTVVVWFLGLLVGFALVSELRSSSVAVSDLGAATPSGAAELLATDASTMLDNVRRDVIATRQHLQRFPVLHVFHAPYDESTVALARGATTLWVAGHFAADEGRPLRRQVKALEQAMRRLCDELARHAEDAGGTSAEQARAVFERARAESVHPQAAQSADVTDDEVELLARLDSVLDGYAAWHAYAAADRAERR